MTAAPTPSLGSPVASSTLTPAHLTIYQAGHFSATFPSTPSFNEIPASLGGTQLTMHIAGVQITVAGGIHSAELVEEAEVNPGLAPSTFDADLRVLLGSAAGVSGAVVTAETATAFHGKPARVGQFSNADGSVLTVLAFIDRPTRIYVISAPAGARFNALAVSLVVLP